MGKKNEMGNEILRIEGVLNEGKKKGLFGKLPCLFIAYENGVFIRANGNQDYINFNESLYIYREDNVYEDEYGRRTIFSYFEKDEFTNYTLLEETFPNLIETVEKLYENEWKQYGKNYPETIKWFLAIISPWLSYYDRPLDLFGPLTSEKSLVYENRKLLLEGWEINNKATLINLCEVLLRCENVQGAKDYYSSTKVEDMPYELIKIREPIMSDYEKTIKANDLFRVVLLAYLGHIAQFFSFEEALDWCLKAGHEIKKSYRNWNEFFENVLIGSCYCNEDDVDNMDSYEFNIKLILDESERYPTYPWQISWNTSLKKDW